MRGNYTNAVRVTMFYLSTQTIENAYRNLTSIEFDKDKSNAIFYFLILKACGINKINNETPNFAEKNGVYFASRISSLFRPDEKQPKKYGFINPFMMKGWPAQAVSEPLKSWIGTRLKNNICGGGMQWRNFIEMDTKNEIKIKLKYDYINWLKNENLDSKTINLYSIAVWSNRFTEFKSKVTAKELMEEFVHQYKLSTDEINQLFNTQQNYELEYANEMYDAAHIRSLIGRAPDEEWEQAKLSSQNISSYVLSTYEYNIKPTDIQDVNVSLIQNLLNCYHQIILEGPPGTSKSYFANEIASNYDEVVHIQFHPQYSYQNFIGGYVVDGTNVVYREGIILRLLNSQKYDSQKKYLLVIDEINRANVSQVLGEVIQCLDRNQSVDIEVNGTKKNIFLPKNINIIATLNTTDKTLGTLDYAIKRRFMTVYCPSNPSILIDLCPSVGFISLCDFLTKLNKKLNLATGNRDLCVGHAIFLSEHVKEANLYKWDFDSFRILYNYKILPMINDYCSNNQDIVEDVVGKKLCNQLDDNSFREAVLEFLEVIE